MDTKGYLYFQYETTKDLTKLHYLMPLEWKQAYIIFDKELRQHQLTYFSIITLYSG